MKELKEFTIKQLTKKIREAIKDNRSRAIFEVGRLLYLVKTEELYASISKSFSEYVREHINLSPRTAQMYVRICEVFKDYKQEHKDFLLGHFEIWGLYQLTRLAVDGLWSEDKVMKFAKENTGLSVRKMIRKINDRLGIKPKKPATERLKDSRRLIEDYEKRIKELTDQVNILKERWRESRKAMAGLKGVYVRMKMKAEGLERENRELRTKVESLEADLRRCKEMIAKYKKILNQINSQIREVA